jgi:hypothetical protein
MPTSSSRRLASFSAPYATNGSPSAPARRSRAMPEASWMTTAPDHTLTLGGTLRYADITVPVEHGPVHATRARCAKNAPPTPLPPGATLCRPITPDRMRALVRPAVREDADGLRRSAQSAADDCAEVWRFAPAVRSAGGRRADSRRRPHQGCACARAPT